MADIKNQLNLSEEIIKGDKNCTELHYDFSRNYNLSSIVGAYFKQHAKEDSQNEKGYYPVITSVKQVSDDIVEIKREYINQMLKNKRDQFQEIITIDRSKINQKPQDVVLESQVNFGYKQEISRIFGYGYLIKRIWLNSEFHKSFSDEKQMKMIRDIQMYKNLKDCTAMTQILRPKLRHKQNKDIVTDLSQSNIADLI